MAEKRDRLSIQINNNCSNSNISINIMSPTSAPGTPKKITNLADLNSKLSLDQVLRTDKNALPNVDSFETPTFALVALPS